MFRRWTRFRNSRSSKPISAPSSAIAAAPLSTWSRDRGQINTTANCLNSSATTISTRIRYFGNAARLAQPHLTRNDFGVTAGGPIFKNKTFFFFDFNGIRALTGATSSEAGVPDAAERTGNFGELCGRAGGTFDSAGVCSNPAGQIYDPYTSKPDAQNNATGRAPVPFDNLATYISPGNPNIPFGLGNLPATPGNLIDPVGAKLIQAFPLPNLNVGTAAYDPYHNWVTTAGSPLSQQSFDIKLDHHFSDKNVASVRFSHEWDAGENPNFFGSVYDTNTQGLTKHSALVGDLNFLHTFSPATLASISLGYAHNWYPTDGVAASFGGFDPAKVLGMPSYIDASGFLTPPSIWLFSAYGCNGFNGCIGGQAYSILKFASETGHLVGSVDHVVGKHEIKIGGELRRHRLNFLQAGSPNGLFSFTNSGTASGTAGVGGDALAGLMIGYVDNAFSRYEIPPFTSTQNYQIGGFVQDNWRVGTRLTLNLGFRYDVETPRTERYNQMSYFDPVGDIADFGSRIESARRGGVHGRPGESKNRVQYVLGRGWPEVWFRLSTPQPHHAARRLRNLLRPF